MAQTCDNTTAWVRHLSDGRIAVAVPNLGPETATVSVCFKDVGWTSGTAKVRNIWSKSDEGSFQDQYSASLESHNTLYVILSQ